MNEQEQTAAIVDLQRRVTELEAGGKAPAPPPTDANKDSKDFYWNNTGVWLDATIPAGQEDFRNITPPPSWSGQLECATGKLSGNETDRIKSRFVGAGGVVLYEDNGWQNLDGYHARFAAAGPAVTWYITSEKHGHISMNCLHQP